MGTGAYGSDLPVDWTAQSLYDLQKYPNLFSRLTSIRGSKATNLDAIMEIQKAFSLVL